MRRGCATWEGLVTFAWVKLAVGDVACRTNGCTLDKAAAGNSCGPSTDGRAANTLFGKCVATGRKARANGEGDKACSDRHSVVPVLQGSSQPTRSKDNGSVRRADKYLTPAETNTPEKEGSSAG
jgi:hypothetical protein